MNLSWASSAGGSDLKVDSILLRVAGGPDLKRDSNLLRVPPVPCIYKSAAVSLKLLQWGSRGIGSPSGERLPWSLWSNDRMRALGTAAQVTYDRTVARLQSYLQGRLP
jgi:hypothetical protein